MLNHSTIMVSAEKWDSSPGLTAEPLTAGRPDHKSLLKRAQRGECQGCRQSALGIQRRRSRGERALQVGLPLWEGLTDRAPHRPCAHSLPWRRGLCWAWDATWATCKGETKRQSGCDHTTGQGPGHGWGVQRKKGRGGTNSSSSGVMPWAQKIAGGSSAWALP